MSKILSFSLLIALFTGCVSTQEWLKTKPQSFQLGYKTGCVNGEDMASNSYIVKSNETDKNYKDDEYYRAGWDEGYDDCKTDKEVEIMMRRPII